MKKTKVTKSSAKTASKDIAKKQAIKLKQAQQQLKMAEKKAKDIAKGANKKLKALQAENKKRSLKAEAKVKSLKRALEKLEKSVSGKNVQKKIGSAKAGLKKHAVSPKKMAAKVKVKKTKLTENNAPESTVN